MASVEAHNLSTGEVRVYSCLPRQAVMAAYAQERNDWETWNYEKKYGHLIRWGMSHVSCGDWSARFLRANNKKEKVKHGV